MCPFSVTVQYVPDRELGPLLTQLSEAGYDKPLINHVDAVGASDKAGCSRSRGACGPPRRLAPRAGAGGRVVPVAEGRDLYEPYRVFMGTTRAEGAVQIGLGETIRENKWGRDRKYVALSGGSSQQPLVESVAADDYEQTRELVAVLRGSDGGRERMASATPSRGLHRTLSNPDLQRAGRPPGRLEQGRRGRSRRRRRGDAQPCADPKPAALPNVETPAAGHLAKASQPVPAELGQVFTCGRGDAAGCCRPVALAASEVARIGAGMSAAPAMTRQKARKRAPISSAPEPIGS